MNDRYFLVILPIKIFHNNLETYKENIQIVIYIFKTSVIKSKSMRYPK